MKGLHFFLPLFALAAAGGAWLAELPLWAILTAFFFAGPLAVLAAAAVHLGEEALTRARHAPPAIPPCPEKKREPAVAGKPGSASGRGRSK